MKWWEAVLLVVGFAVLGYIVYYAILFIEAATSGPKGGN